MLYSSVVAEEVDEVEDVSTIEKAKLLARQLKTIEDVMKYIHAGKAIFTVRSLESGTRFTYKVLKPKAENHNPRSPYPYDDNAWFVRVLCGPDNTSNYRYLGMIKRKFEESVAYPGIKIEMKNFYTTRATQPSTLNSPSAKAFGWLYERLSRNHMPTNVEIWHSGRCGRCGKLLTVPKSIEQGLGPECASK